MINKCTNTTMRVQLVLSNLYVKSYRKSQNQFIIYMRHKGGHFVITLGICLFFFFKFANLLHNARNSILFSNFTLITVHVAYKKWESHLRIVVLKIHSR